MPEETEKTVELPKCPECNMPLEEVQEHVEAVQEWFWDKEKQYYAMGEEKWYDVVTRCGNCQTEIDNNFLLDHLQPTEERHYYPFPVTLKEFTELKEAYRRFGEANQRAETDEEIEDAYEKFLRVCEKTLK